MLDLSHSHWPTVENGELRDGKAVYCKEDHLPLG